MPTIRTTEFGKVYTRSNTTSLWIRFAGSDGQEIRKSAGTEDVEQAVRVLEAQAKRHFELTFKTAVVDFFVVSESRLKPSTLSGYRSLLRSVNPYFGESTLSEINRTSLKRFVAARQREVGPTTVRRELAFLSTVISHAIECLDGAPEANSVIAFSKKRLQETKRLRWLSPSEYDSLLKACTEQMHRDIVEVACHTGMRSAELKALRKPMLDFDRNQVVLPGHLTKNGTPRIIPLNPHALRTVQRVCETAPGDLVFWHWDQVKSQQLPYQEFRRFFTSARRRAKLIDLHFHDLRHTFASWWVQRGGDVYTLQHILGHSSTQMVQRYAHLTSDAQHRAMSDLFPHSFDVLEGKIPHSTE